MDDIAKYLIKSPKQVLSYLNMLSAERCLISAAFGEDEKDTFLTVIMDIDEKKQTITIDCGPKEYLNKKLLNSAVIKFAAEYKGIKVLFEGRDVKKAGKIGQPAFTIRLPKSIYWIQRRRFYRVKSPMSKQSFCLIHSVDPETNIDTSMSVNIYDLSANGFSIINESSEYSELLTPPATFENCELSLDNEAGLPVSIEIRNKFPLNPLRPEKSERIGCRITNLTPRVESTILRYMQNIEREIKQKEK
ncbi:MAG: flagellar brake protein [Methylococcales bacterium]|nr:flagellar brake protein [Methylococcales bacterium]